jgi:hypothetical protein
LVHGVFHLPVVNVWSELENTDEISGQRFPSALLYQVYTKFDNLSLAATSGKPDPALSGMAAMRTLG